MSRNPFVNQVVCFLFSAWQIIGINAKMSQSLRKSGRLFLSQIKTESNPTLKSQSLRKSGRLFQVNKSAHGTGSRRVAIPS